jgi:predicted nuclease of predicted toxin-antitoxin system
MKLLLDENLSHKLVAAISSEFPGSDHVRNIGLKSVDDGLIWKYALENGFAIVSKDADFHQRSLMHGHPPKVIGVFAGNCPTSIIRNLLLTNKERILQFNIDIESSFLQLIAA